MSHEQPNAAALDEELVAYLDGELDAENARRIEALLASDPQTRRRLQSLERTWDLLDELDTAPVGEPFTQTTLEMVAVAANRDAEQDQAEAPRRRRRRWITIAWIALAAAVAGFLAVALLWPNPNRQLLKDLPLLEALDEYRQIDSIEYLRKLRESGLFSGMNDPSFSKTALAQEDLSARRRRIEAMSPGEKEQLLQVQDRFAALAPEEQKRLRNLYQVMTKAPDAAQLRAVMHAYCAWLRGLSSYSRAELAERDQAARIAWIKRRIAQERQRFQSGERLNDQDLKALVQWMGECASRHEKPFLATLNEKQRKWLGELNVPMRRLMFWIAWQQKQMTDPNKPGIVTDDDLATLRPMLSEPTRKQLETLPTAAQWRLVSLWMHQAARHSMVAPSRAVPKSFDQQMADFFDNGLSDEDRDRLLNLPPEEMLRELHRLFFTRMRPGEGPMFRPDDRPRGRWPGDRPPPNQKPPEDVVPIFPPERDF